MASACSVCAHPERAKIDRALFRLEPLRRVGERYGLSRAALSRHARVHPLNARGVVRRGNRRAGIYRAPCPHCGALSTILLRCYICPNGCPVVVYGRWDKTPGAHVKARSVDTP